jgi:hypothetical protein
MAERSERIPSQRALRLLVEYRGTRLTLRDRTRVEKAIPPSDAIRGFEGESGFWVELRSKNGELLYRRIIHNPIAYDVEAYDEERGPRRHRVGAPAGVFSVLVPDLPEADSLVVVSSPLDPDKAAQPAEPLARIPVAGRKRGGK